MIYFKSILYFIEIFFSTKKRSITQLNFIIYIIVIKKYKDAFVLWSIINLKLKKLSISKEISLKEYDLLYFNYFF